MFKLVIDRKRWHRGAMKDGNDSSLRVKATGNMCCLGQFALAAGATERQITDQPGPNNIQRQTRNNALKHKFFKKLYEDPNTCYNLMETNDKVCMSDRMREFRLKRLFKKIEVAVTFKG